MPNVNPTCELVSFALSRYLACALWENLQHALACHRFQSKFRPLFCCVGFILHPSRKTFGAQTLFAGAAALWLGCTILTELKRYRASVSPWRRTCCCENFPHFTLQLLLMHRPHCMVGCRGAFYFSSLPRHQRRVWAAFRLCCSLLTEEFLALGFCATWMGMALRLVNFRKRLLLWQTTIFFVFELCALYVVCLLTTNSIPSLVNNISACILSITLLFQISGEIFLLQKQHHESDTLKHSILYGGYRPLKSRLKANALAPYLSSTLGNPQRRYPTPYI